jgi:hypothetical protein
MPSCSGRTDESTTDANGTKNRAMPRPETMNAGHNSE